MQDWTKMPSGWIIREEKLKSFGLKNKAVSISSLIIYSACIINCNQEPNAIYPAAGYARLSYSMLGNLTSLSRTQISKGISNLEGLGLIEVNREHKPSTFKVLNFTQKGQSGWAKFPGKRIINSKIFEKLHLRHKNELNALKLYFLLTAHRNTALNSTNIGYEKIETYTGIKRTDICSAISLLINYGLVQVERGVGDINARSNTYRVCGIDHRHAGNMNYEDYNTKAAMKEFGVVEA